MSRPAPEVVFLDIDDTLYGTSDFAGRARAAAVEAMIQHGVDASPETVLAELAGVVAEFGSNDDRHYDRLLKRLPEAATRGINRDLVVVAGVIAYHNAKWRELSISAQDEEVLTALSAAGLRLGIITAGLARKQMEKILRLGLDRHVDQRLIFITDSVGIAKTNPLLYRRCAEEAGVAPERAMHVGDHPQRDIECAAQAGLTTVWVRRGRHAAVEPATPADHEVKDLAGLREVLRDAYGLDL